MQFNKLIEFRHALYTCFLKAPDALFEACDAPLNDPTAQPFAELSLAACCHRR